MYSLAALMYCHASTSQLCPLAQNRFQVISTGKNTWSGWIWVSEWNACRIAKDGNTYLMDWQRCAKINDWHVILKKKNKYIRVSTLCVKDKDTTGEVRPGYPWWITAGDAGPGMQGPIARPVPHLWGIPQHPQHYRMPGVYCSVSF